MRVFPEQANVLSTLGVCATHPLPVSNQKPAAAPDRTTAASTRDLPGLLFACRLPLRNAVGERLPAFAPRVGVLFVQDDLHFFADGAVRLQDVGDAFDD